MTEAQRSSVRFSLTLSAQVRVCDSETFKPLSPAFPVQIVDVSSGGAKLELAGLPEAVSHLFAPGITLEVRVKGAELTLDNNVYLSVAWYRHRMEDGRIHGTLGGRFLSIGADDLGAVVSYAHQHHAPPDVGRSLGWLIPAVPVVLVIALAIYSVRLRTQVAELKEQVAELEVQARAASRVRTLPTPVFPASALAAAGGSVAANVPPGTGSSPLPGAGTTAGTTPSVSPGNGLAPGPGLAPGSSPGSSGTGGSVAGLAPPTPANSPATAASGADAGREAVGHEGGGEPEVTEKPAGIELTSLEIIGSDFIGTLASKLSTLQRVSVELNFPCNAGDGRCQCRIAEIGVPANGRVEFSCTPETSQPRNPVKAAVRLRTGG